MAKDSSISVRSHSQECEWLLRLGEGNIIAGVRSLIRQAKGKDDSAQGEDKKSKK